MLLALKDVLFIVIVVLTALISKSKTVLYNGYKLYQVNAGEGLLPLLDELESVDGFDFDDATGNPRTLIDVWLEPHRNRPYAHVMVAPEFESKFCKLLRRNGFYDFAVIKSDVQSDIDRLQRHKHRRRHKRRLHTSNDFSVRDYHSFDEIVDYLNLLTFEYPHIASKFFIGSTFEKRSIVGIKIGQKISRKPAIFIDAGIHAREWIAPASALYLIDRLVKDYGRDPAVTSLVNNFDWFIVPVANPDGYVYSFEKDRLWRKTRSYNATVNKWCVGVDANRNWGGRGWGEIGGSRSPCSNIFAGSTAFSEPEVDGMRTFVERHVQNLMIYLSLHSYGQLFLSPWGYTSDKPSNHADQRRAAGVAVSAIRNATGAVYNYGTISELMYPASGTSIDYMQELGIPYIYGIELRPGDMDEAIGFMLPKNLIEPTGRELFAALSRMTDYVIEHRRLKRLRNV